jgi:hypothetical protein
MHGFHTYEVDQFVFPETCSRCAKDESTQTWRLVHSTIQFPDGMPTGAPGERRDYVDYITQVPVCDKCHTALKRGSRLCWLLGAVGGAVAAYFVMDYMVPAGIKLQGCILSAVAAAGVTTVLLGWTFKLIAVDGFGFAKLDGLNNKIKFKNKEYQRLFDEKNGAWRPVAGSAKDAAAAQGW